MSGLKYPLLASITGKAIYALSSLSMLPLVTGILGKEAVGLLGFFTSLLMIMMVLEGGLTSAIVRELAGNKRPVERSVVRYLRYNYSLTNTYLLFFLGVGILVTLFVISISGPLAADWLEFEELSVIQVQRSIVWMALFIGLNFPILILQGALIGNERQVCMNSVYIPYALLRTFGVLAVLYLLGESASVELFFFLQVLVQLIYFISLLIVFYYEGRGLFLLSPPRWRLLRRGFQFSSGVMLIALTSAVVVQFDKMYLSGLLPLDIYAVYALASTFASIPYIISSALQAVLFPRFSLNVVTGDYVSIEKIFKGALSGLGLIVVAMSSAAWFFSVYPLNIIFDAELAGRTSQIVPILLMGTSLQALLIIPYALQLAAGWTSFSLRLNLCLIPFIVIGMPLMANRFGMTGVAWVWFFYNLICFSLTLYFVLKRYPILYSAVFSFMKISTVFLSLSLPVFIMLLAWVVPGLSDVVALSIQVFAVAVMVILVGILYRRDIAGFL